MDYGRLVRQANSYPIDPVMAAYQAAAPELGASASGRAQPSPTDADMIRGFIPLQAHRAIDPLLHTLFGAIRGYASTVAGLPRSQAAPSYPAQTGLPTQLREAPAANLRMINPYR